MNVSCGKACFALGLSQEGNFAFQRSRQMSKLQSAVPEFAKQKLRPADPVAAGSEHDHDESAPSERTQARRDFVAAIGESLANECLENRQMVRMLDITTESKPFGVR